MLIKRFFLLAFGPVVGAFLSFITLPFIAYFFSLEDVGKFSILQVFLTLTTSLFSLQMYQSYVREYYEVDDKVTLLKISFLPGFFILMITFFLFLLTPFSMSKLLFNIESIKINILLYLSIFSSFFIIFFIHAIRMNGNDWSFVISQIFPKLFLFVCLTIFIIFEIKSNFLFLIESNTITLVLSMFLLAILLKINFSIFDFRKLNISLMYRMIIFSSPLIISSLCYWGINSIDRFFIKNYLDFENLGIYSLASNIGAFVTIISTIFTTIWHPIIYKWAKNGIESNKIQNMIDILFVFICFIWSLFGIFSSFFSVLLPNKYELIQYVVLGCVSAQLLNLLSEASSVGIGISRGSIYLLYASLSSFLVNLGLNYFLIPIWGIEGASISIMLSFYLFFILKTEFSIYLWEKMDRKLIYIIILLYIVNTIFIILVKPEFFIYKLSWLILFVLTLMLFLKKIHRIILNRSI